MARHSANLRCSLATVCVPPPLFLTMNVTSFSSVAISIIAQSQRSSTKNTKKRWRSSTSAASSGETALKTITLKPEVHVVGFCSDWADKWKKSVALSVVRVRLSYDEILVRQTEEADNLFFVTSGELKLVADAEQHKQQFADVMKSASNVLLDDKCVRTTFSTQYLKN